MFSQLFIELFTLFYNHPIGSNCVTLNKNWVEKFDLVYVVCKNRYSTTFWTLVVVLECVKYCDGYFNIIFCYSESTENPAKYTSNCTSLLNLQCLPRGNLVAVGTTWCSTPNVLCDASLQDPDLWCMYIENLKWGIWCLFKKSLAYLK